MIASASNWPVSSLRGSGRPGDGHQGTHGQSGRVRGRGSFNLPPLDLQAVVHDHPAPFETAFGERVEPVTWSGAAMSSSPRMAAA